MRELIDEWQKTIDLNKNAKIIATLYSLGHIDPHSTPKANDRGMQIVEEFYPLAKKWLQ